jgi:predicted nucleotidyltransferase
MGNEDEIVGVDYLASSTKPRPSRFDAYVDLTDELEQMVGMPVDLVGM